MIKVFYFNQLRTCCYVLYDDTRRCVVIDPGFSTDNEGDRLVRFMEENDLTPEMVINTHGHFDHVMGNRAVSDRWRVPVRLNHGDLHTFSEALKFGGYFGYKFTMPEEIPSDISDGEVISFGNTSLAAMLTPGHSRGSMVFYNEAEKYLVSGDTLFASSIGRTDLPEGDYDEIAASLHHIFKTYPDDTVVYPGHGPATSIGDERLKNPFILEMGI